MEFRQYRYILLILALVLFACRLSQPRQDSSDERIIEETPASEESLPPTNDPSETEGTGMGAGTTSTPYQAPPAAGEAPAAAGKPPQSQAAEIRPPELRNELTRLSTLLGFQVTDRNGAALGTVADYIINTCETYLIYFVLDPAESLNVAPGSQLIIPFEVVTINSGALDAQANAINLSLAPEQLAGAPAFPGPMELLPTDWEADLRDYWSQAVRLSNLTTGCRVPAPQSDPAGGTVTIHKVAYATDLLGAGLQDGRRNLLGTVEEAILEPESGKLSFFVVNLQDGQGRVLVPLRVVNIPNWALEPGTEVSLVLLTENDVLQNAPRFDAVEDAASGEAQNAARQYWGR